MSPLSCKRVGVMAVRGETSLQIPALGVCGVSGSGVQGDTLEIQYIVASWQSWINDNIQCVGGVGGHGLLLGKGGGYILILISFLYKEIVDFCSI